MAHTKSQGAVEGNRDSISKRLGLKASGGQKVLAGNIIVRQRGTKLFAGQGTSIGRDFTIFAVSPGYVNFKNRQGKKYVEILNQAQKRV